MNFIVVGCGRLGAELAYRLYAQKHHVVVVDENESAFDNLPPDFRGRTIIGDALNKGTLERAGIENADGLAAVTSSDQVNAVVVHIAREAFKVKYLVARNYDPHFFPVLQAFDQHVVSSTLWGAQRIEELMYFNDMHTIHSAGNGEVELYEIRVPQAFHGKRLGDLVPKVTCVPVALTRHGQAFIPDCDTLVETGDLVQVSATFEGATAIRKNLVPASEKEG